MSKTKVIDMTGPEQRILSGYSALSIRKTVEPNDNESAGINKDKLQLDKLSCNLDILVNLCEQVISFPFYCFDFIKVTFVLLCFCSVTGNYTK